MKKKNINGYCFSLCKINDLVSIGTSIGKILMYKIFENEYKVRMYKIFKYLNN